MNLPQGRAGGKACLPRLAGPRAEATKLVTEHASSLSRNPAGTSPLTPAGFSFFPLICSGADFRAFALGTNRVDGPGGPRRGHPFSLP